MKETKIEKGITLVALLITIVVLVLLAGVSIASIQNNNITERANSAAYEYTEQKYQEDMTIGSYNEKLDSFIPGADSDSDSGTTEEGEFKVEFTGTSTYKVLSGTFTPTVNVTTSGLTATIDVSGMKNKRGLLNSVFTYKKFKY